MKKYLYALCLGSLAFIGCQRPSNYLYIVPDPRHVDAQHKLKEMTGNSDLDILFVIDNSGSMSAHQQTVIANTDQFIDGLVAGSNLHWRTAMISTSRYEDPYLGMKPGDLADYTMPNVNTRFKTAVQNLGLNGDSTERTFDPVIDAFTNYPNFLRPGAWLAIILISDAPEQSQMTTDAFVQSLMALKGGKKDQILFYGFLNPSDWCVPTDDAFTWLGSKFEMLLRQINGSAYKLCDPNFGSNLANLGANLASVVVTPKITLPDRPIPSSLHIFHNNVEVPGGKGGFWIYRVDWNAIVFTDLSFAPGANESVRIVYDVDDGIQR